jgi:V/A-type H+-transporting ATPase subunit E
MKAEKTHVASSGVEELIKRLRDEAVNAGQEKAETIIVDAQKRVDWMLEEAKSEAQAILSQAHAEAETIKSAGNDALRLAGRDALIKLRDTLLGSFSKELKGVVGEQMAKEAFIEQLIMALAGRVREKTGMDQNSRITFQLPEDVIGVEALKKNPEELNQGILSRLTAAIAADLLREGVNFEISDQFSAGIQVKLDDQDIVIDLTDEAVSALLLEHLQPRFRALLQGIVK